MSTRIIVFAKAPVAGRVKTRLIPALGAQGAAELARAMLARTLQAALDAGCGPVELCGDPHPDDPIWANTTLPAGVQCSAQGNGDLGQRMARAAQRTLSAGERALLIGTDCVEMGPALLLAAARTLEHADAFMHPTADGGYALLGLRHFDADVFEGIPWSTPSVATDTRARLAALGWTLVEGASLHDVDVPADLARWSYHA
jgi:rSAM/selenodomain-associated transferase 1